jgi:acyl-CoA dehydrogenase
MLLTMKSLTQAARSVAYNAAGTLDVAHLSKDEKVRATALRRADLLTPVVKAWCSDVAVEVASLGVQIHGGMGYIDDAEISQVYRDSRIGPIFEGTNYIQAQDLLARKVIRDKGAALGDLLTEIETAAAAAAIPEPLRSGLLDNCRRMRAATADLVAKSLKEPDLIGASAYTFLQWLGVLTGAWQLALGAARAPTDLEPNDARATLDIAAFYATHVLPRTLAYEATLKEGLEAVAQVSLSDL